jgi:hypothetical protein
MGDVGILVEAPIGERATVASAPIFAAANGASVQVGVPPYSVVVAFPRR